MEKTTKITVGSAVANVFLRDTVDVFSVSWNLSQNFGDDPFDNGFTLDTVVVFRNIRQAKFWFNLMVERLESVLSTYSQEADLVHKVSEMVYGG